MLRNACEYKIVLHGVAKDRDVLFLEKESMKDPRVEIAINLLVRMKQDIKKRGEGAIRDFRKDYLKETGGGYFDTVIRDAISNIYTAIADCEGLRDEANEYWQ